MRKNIEICRSEIYCLWNTEGRKLCRLLIWIKKAITIATFQPNLRVMIQNQANKSNWERNALVSGVKPKIGCREPYFSLGNILEAQFILVVLEDVNQFYQRMMSSNLLRQTNAFIAAFSIQVLGIEDSLCNNTFCKDARWLY